MRLRKTWTEFKALIVIKKLVIQYEENLSFYLIWADEGNTSYWCKITKESGNADQTDFEDNYKVNANQPIIPLSEDNKQIVRAESRPLNCTTCFTCIGDSATEIGKGKEFSWCFANDDDDITPSGVTYKRKRIEFNFIDSVWLKEGTFYFYDMPKGSYVDVCIICPTGAYYYDSDGNLQQATEDTAVAHYVMHHMMEGTVAMGDELNTESCSTEIPNYYKFRIDVTIPEESGSTAHGNFELELYRKRTVIL